MTEAFDPAVSTQPLWGASTRTCPAAGDDTCGLLVVGAGTVGLTVALTAARAGADVVVAESARIGAGTSASTLGLAALLRGVTAQQVEANHGSEAVATYVGNLDRALSFIEHEVARSGFEAMHFPSLATVEDGHRAHYLHRERFAMRPAGINPIADDEFELPFPTRPAIRIDRALGLQPRMYVEALGRAVLAAGGRIYEETALDKLKPGPIVGARFRTRDMDGRMGQATIRARSVVVATGVPEPDLGLLAARVVPTTVHVLAGHGVDLDAAYQVVDDPDAPFTLRPSGRGGQVVVSGRAHPRGVNPGLAADELLAWVRTRMPGLQITHRWSYDCYRSYDGLPLVGPVGAWARGVYAATGFGDDHTALATAGALQLSDHLIAGNPSLPWSPIHSRGTFAKQAKALAATARPKLKARLFS